MFQPTDVPICIFFNFLDFEKALELYTQGIEMCPKDFQKTRAILYSNRAACHMKTVSEKFDATLRT